MRSRLVGQYHEDIVAFHANLERRLLRCWICYARPCGQIKLPRVPRATNSHAIKRSLAERPASVATGVS